MNANERFEYMAEQLYKKTGMLAPGKDCPAAFGRSEDDIIQRDKEWAVFIESFYANLFQAHVDMYKHIERDIEILQRQAKQCVIGSYELAAINSRIETKQKILKRARGE